MSTNEYSKEYDYQTVSNKAEGVSPCSGNPLSESQITIPQVCLATPIHPRTIPVQQRSPSTVIYVTAAVLHLLVKGSAVSLGVHNDARAVNKVNTVLP